MSDIKISKIISSGVSYLFIWRAFYKLKLEEKECYIVIKYIFNVDYIIYMSIKFIHSLTMWNNFYKNSKMQQLWPHHCQLSINSTTNAMQCYIPKKSTFKIFNIHMSCWTDWPDYTGSDFLETNKVK